MFSCIKKLNKKINWDKTNQQSVVVGFFFLSFNELFILLKNTTQENSCLNTNNDSHFLFPLNLCVTAAQFGASLFIANYQHPRHHPAA